MADNFVDLTIDSADIVDLTLDSDKDDPPHQPSNAYVNTTSASARGHPPAISTQSGDSNSSFSYRSPFLRPTPSKRTSLRGGISNHRPSTRGTSGPGTTQARTYAPVHVNSGHARSRPTADLQARKMRKITGASDNENMSPGDPARVGSPSRPENPTLVRNPTLSSNTQKLGVARRADSPILGRPQRDWNINGTRRPVAEPRRSAESRRFEIGTTKRDGNKGLGFYGPGSSKPQSGANGVSNKSITSWTENLETDKNYVSLGSGLSDSELDAETALRAFKARRNPRITAEADPGSKEQISIRPSSSASHRSTTIHPLPSSSLSPPPDMLRSPRGHEGTDGQSEVTAIHEIPSCVPKSLKSYHGKGVPWQQEETDLLIYLREVMGLTWREVGMHFPKRNPSSVQVIYSRDINKRDRDRDPPDLKEAITAAGGMVAPRAPIVPQFKVYKPKPVQVVTEPEEAKVRPRRAVQPVNYTLPRRNQALHTRQSMSIGREEAEPQPRSASEVSRSYETSEEPSGLAETAAPVDVPFDIDVDHEDASIALRAAQGKQAPAGQPLLYLDYVQRQVQTVGATNGQWDLWSGRDWQGVPLHVDFSQEELDMAEKVALNVVLPSTRSRSSSTRKRIQQLLQDLPTPRLFKLSAELTKKLPARDRESVDAFLRDATNGRLHTNPQIQRIGAPRKDRAFTSNAKQSSVAMIRSRELGQHATRGWRATSRPLSYQMQNNVFDTMGPAYSYTGASSDVHTVAWSPNGECFAAGAICVTDRDSMQYNRPNNLLYGDVLRGTIYELGEHYTMRFRPEGGANSSHAMFVSQDPKLYQTVSMVAFSPDGEYMYSAGYDAYATIWQTKRRGSQPEVLRKLQHSAPVDLLTVGPTGLVATAAKKEMARAVKLLKVNSPDEIDKFSFTSQRAQESPNLKIMPTALKFEPIWGRLLLGGFGASVREDGRDTSGDICVWDVETQQQLPMYGGSRNVFDVAFNPRPLAPLFAVGCVAGGNVNRGTKSVVRFYDQRGPKYGLISELECPALDMNDVVYCPYDEYLFAAGCTDGNSYVWDVRRPDSFLYKLSHGIPLMQLDEQKDREKTDTGIRFCSWGNNGSRLYTGSSDGVVKIWDVARSTDDVFIKDMVTCDSGVMCGALSPDGSRLVVGEVNGSVTVLEVGRDDYTVKDAEKLRYIPYEPNDCTASDSSQGSNIPGRDAPESGRAIARELLTSKQMKTVPLGGLPIRQAVRGDNYNGPWDLNEDAPALRNKAFIFQRDMNLLRSTAGAQCNIASCVDSARGQTITAEELGDSGRSADRIPDQLHRLWLDTPSLANQHIFVPAPGKVKCGYDQGRCNLPALPTQNSDEETPICEIHGFSCFRCGHAAMLSSNKARMENGAPQEVVCWICGGVWEAGVLGYEFKRRDRNTLIKDWASDSKRDHDVPRLDKWDKMVRKREMKRDEGTSYGDELNALSEYYYGMTLARSESPAL